MRTFYKNPMFVSLLPVFLAAVLTPVWVAWTTRDSVWYLSRAGAIAAAEYWSMSRIGFTLPLALLMKVFPDPLVAGVVLVRLVFLLTVILCWFIGRRFGGYLGAFLFTAFLLANETFHIANLRILSDGYSPFLTLLGIYAVWLSYEEKRLDMAWLAAAILFAALVTRASAITALAVPGLYLLLSRSVWRTAKAQKIAAITTLTPAVLYALFKLVVADSDGAEVFFDQAISFFFHTQGRHLIPELYEVFRVYVEDLFVPSAGPLWLALLLVVGLGMFYKEDRSRFLLCALAAQIPAAFVFSITSLRVTQNLVVIFLVLLGFAYLLSQLYDRLRYSNATRMALITIFSALIMFEQATANNKLLPLLRYSYISGGTWSEKGPVSKDAFSIMDFAQDQKAQMVFYDIGYDLARLNSIPQYRKNGILFTKLASNPGFPVSDTVALETAIAGADIVWHRWYWLHKEEDLFTRITTAPEYNLFTISFSDLCGRTMTKGKHLVVFTRRWGNVNRLLKARFDITPIRSNKFHEILDFNDLREGGACEFLGVLYVGEELAGLDLKQETRQIEFFEAVRPKRMGDAELVP